MVGTPDPSWDGLDRSLTDWEEDDPWVEGSDLLPLAGVFVEVEEEGA